MIEFYRFAKRRKTMGEFIVKKTEAGFIFRLKSANSRTIGISQAYVSMANAKIGIDSVKTNAASHVEDQTAEGFEVLTHPKYVVYTDKTGEYRFKLIASNGESILASHGYKSKSGCINGIASIGKNAPDAEIVDESRDTITKEEAYENDQDMEFMTSPSTSSEDSGDETAVETNEPAVPEEPVSEPVSGSSSGSCGCGGRSPASEEDETVVVVEETVVVAYTDGDGPVNEEKSKKKKHHRRKGIFRFFGRRK